jgi:uncharacterized membrane protein
VNNWKVIFATVVIFSAGVITGGLLVNYVQHPYHKPVRSKAVVNPPPRVAVTNSHPVDNVKPRLPESLSRQFLLKLDEVLALQPEQRESIQKIISEGQNQMRKVMQDARLEIREVLTPEQRQQFDELIKRPPRKPPAGTNAAPNVPAFPAAPVTNAPAL